LAKETAFQNRLLRLVRRTQVSQGLPRRMPISLNEKGHGQALGGRMKETRHGRN